MRLAVFLFFACLASAQNPSASDPQALSLAAQSIAGMTGGSSITDLRITGNATSIAGDIETGTVTLLAKGTSESRMVLSLSGGTRTETRNASAGVSQGKWVNPNPNGSSGRYAWHNTLTDAVWFFPVLSSLALSANSASLFSYVGQESRNGISAQHLRVYQLQPSSIAAAVPMSNLSMMDFYLDSTSLLPLAIAFKIHPDNDMNTDIPTEIRFADYRAVSGVQVPFHIQRLINGGVSLDVVVTSATLNSGLPDTQFSIQ